MEIIACIFLLVLAFVFGVVFGRRKKMRIIGDLMFEHDGQDPPIVYMAAEKDLSQIGDAKYVTLCVKHIKVPHK